MKQSRKKRPGRKKTALVLPRYDVRVLDHLVLCGPATSTHAMYLVRELYPGARPTVFHQVFIDRHGTYCANHGTECPAIQEVDKVRHPKPERLKTSTLTQTKKKKPK